MDMISHRKLSSVGEAYTPLIRLGILFKLGNACRWVRAAFSLVFEGNKLSCVTSSCTIPTCLERYVPCTIGYLIE